jgi:hypothetical protein
MRRSFAKLLFGALALAAPLFVANQAHAGVCGWLADGQVNCELDVTGGCEAKCTPVNFTAQCGYNCQGGCHGSIDVNCTASCQDSCTGSCMANPGSFSCTAHCQDTCEGECATTCKGNKDETTCITQCKGSCEGDCSAHCQATPPSASCDVQCQASCQGECHAKANLDCEIQCQGGCSAQLTGGCKADCQAPQGALFCDGQYVTVDNIDDCSAFVDVKAQCSGNSCTVTASACSTAAPGGDAPLDFAALGAMALGCGLIVTRRRRDKK